MNSYWDNIRKEYKSFEPLKEDISCDVCIIGAGLTGLSTAYYLNKYAKVVVLDADKICSHASGKNTGKVTSQHGLFYKYLKDSIDNKYAEKYLEANETAIDNIENIVKKENIDCDFERETAYIFTRKDSEMPQLKEEADVVNKLTKKNTCKISFDTELPMHIEAAVEWKEQAKIHPIKYGYGLANAIIKNGNNIYENTKVIDLKDTDYGYEVYTQSTETENIEKHKILAKHVVIATRYPFVNFPGYYFLKMYQSTSFAIIADVKEKLFEGMYISNDMPIVSFRVIKENGKELLLAVGEDYKTGKKDELDSYKMLEATVKNMYPKAEILYKWSTEDCISLDKIPYIGEFSKLKENLYVATGYKKWGITISNIAAKIITDKILGKQNEYEELFKATRLEPIKNRDELKNMVQEAGKSIVLSKFKIPDEKLKDIPKGEAKIIEIENVKVGIYKDEVGTIYKVNPVCTHLGCELSFNKLDKLWECPCHGSKFTYEGKVVEVPSIKDLDHK